MAKPTKRQIFDRIDACHRTLPPNVALGWTEMEYNRFRMDNGLIPDRPLPGAGDGDPMMFIHGGTVTLLGATFGAERFSDPESERDRHFTLKREGEGEGVSVEVDVDLRAGGVKLLLDISLSSPETDVDPEVRFVGVGHTEEDALREAEVRLRLLYDRGMAALHDLRAKLKEGG